MSFPTADYLVIGSGIAGLWFSHRVSRHGSVLLITKKADTESNTNYAQGGIAAAVAGDDSPELHYEDTLRAGCGIVHPAVVRLVTESGPALVRELFALGVAFSTRTAATPAVGQAPDFDLGQEGGHSRRRIVHARDFTGLEIEHGLLRAVRAARNVTVLEEHFAVDLALDTSGRCCGAYVLDKSTGHVELVRSKMCLLAAGGIGQAYRHTTNPAIATGDGIAMGYRAGARVASMEFIQFHPTSLYGHRLADRAFLISEAVRGEGAILRTPSGDAFMKRYHADAELAPRDVVARAIATEMKLHGHEYVLLDATGLGRERLKARFPNIHETCLRLGLDIAERPIPVVPAAHYVCGGLETNEWAETSVPGLFAAGECACSGLHGANRLASNSLLEALVFADRAAERVRTTLCRECEPQGVGDRTRVKEPISAGVSHRHQTSGVEGEASGMLARLQTLMWDKAGIVRSDRGLGVSRDELREMQRAAESACPDPAVPALELRNLLVVARLVVECALRRSESRGLHFNEDHPESSDAFRQDTVITRQELETGCGC